MKLRIKFKKYGAVRFIGHLDVMRFFQKAIRRAGIDVAYSQGTWQSPPGYRTMGGLFFRAGSLASGDTG